MGLSWDSTGIVFLGDNSGANELISWDETMGFTGDLMWLQVHQWRHNSKSSFGAAGIRCWDPSVCRVRWRRLATPKASATWDVPTWAGSLASLARTSCWKTFRFVYVYIDMYQVRYGGGRTLGRRPTTSCTRSTTSRWGARSTTSRWGARVMTDDHGIWWYTCGNTMG